ncbi:testis-expressed protein 9-like isoform X2 [Girardinichthys multiradiatus]|nr:testis-expressed protein 9-like isoform X2 [Girardinichthys multiradiatus]
MRGQNEVLSSPLSNVFLLDAEDEDGFRNLKSQPRTTQDLGMKRCDFLDLCNPYKVSKKKVTSATQSMHAGNQGNKLQFKTASLKDADDSAALGDGADLFLAKTIQSMEEKMKDSDQDNLLDNAEDCVGSAASDAQTRVLKAKLQIMQEELDLLSCDFYKKDDENAKLTANIKELEEDRARLQRTVSIQKTQTERQKALAEESAKKCNDLQLQVAALSKEVETLNRSQKQAAAVHRTVEVRLNRALEEVEKLKSQLSKTRQMNKEKISEEHQSKENLLAENQILKKQKAELIAGFKKQLKLISILKRSKVSIFFDTCHVHVFFLKP